MAGFAFFSSVNLIGTISPNLNSQPMEYLFEFQQLAQPTDALSAGAWQPVLPNMIDKTVIGYLWTLTGNLLNPVSTEDYFINGTGTEKTVSFNGNWIQVPQESNFAAHVDAEILKLNTEKLAGASLIDMSMPTSAIGSSTVSAARPHIRNQYYAIRMRKRQVGNPATEVTAGTSKAIAIYNVKYNNVNKNGSWAPSTESNQYIALSVDIAEIVAGLSVCSKITSQLHVKYGARNENLGSVSLSITGPALPGGTYSFDPISVLAAPETVGTAQLVFNPAVKTVQDLLPCAYTVTIWATALLTNGEDHLGAYRDFVSFCKV